MTPIQFTPLLKTTLWGGDKIIPFKHLDSQLANVGESWEISGVEGSQTVAANGPYKGMLLNDIVKLHKENLVGRDNYHRYGDEFPLLVKFIDATQNLSIQVHPNDETALRQGKPRGKTEMWYVMESDKGAKIYSGLKQQITPEQYKQMVADDTICDALAQYEAKEGDVFYLPGGRIHSICSGCFLVEIQQTSDITYRIYDYKRRDKDGHYRQLHTSEAAESIDFHVENDYRTHYIPKTNEGVPLVSCPHFTTALYDLNEDMTIDYSELDSFVILVGLRGQASLTDNEGNTFSFSEGESILIPAATQTISLEGNIKFLETFI